MKKLFRKLGLLALPFIALMLVELFALPLHTFNFRAWEALLVKQTVALFPPGPFYPNHSLEKTEQGDLAHGTSQAVAKLVNWTTDSYGYRNEPGADQKPDIVVVGGSNTVGTSLTQSDTLASQIERRTGLKTYAMGLRYLQDFLRDERFKAHPPRLVIVESMERSLGDLPTAVDKDALHRHDLWRRSPFVARVGELLDRALKRSMYKALKARVNRAPMLGRAYPGTDMLFLQGEDVVRELPTREIARLADMLALYKRLLDKRGVALVFLPVPNKETAYFDTLPSRRKPSVIPELVAAAAARGVTAIDTQRVMAQARLRAPTQLLYHLDDSHWNARGVGVVADAVAQILMTGLTKQPTSVDPRAR